jgi:cation diffusion facilitator family transporter
MAQASMERKATRVAVIVAVVLLFTKLLAYRLTGSTAVFGDAMESLVNVAASLLAVWSVWMAHRPADRTHPYGHGKAEFVSAAIEGGLVLAAAGAVAFKCVNDFGAAEQPLQSIDMGLLLLASTVLVNGVVGGWLLHLGKSGGSAALEADGIHLLSDAWTSGGAIISLILVRASGMQWIDPVIALLMAAWLVWCGWRVVRRSLGNLMDEQDLGDLDRVQKLLDQHCRDGVSTGSISTCSCRRTPTCAPPMNWPRSSRTRSSARSAARPRRMPNRARMRPAPTVIAPRSRVRSSFLQPLRSLA